MWLSTNSRQRFFTSIEVTVAPGKSHDSLHAIGVTLKSMGKMGQHQNYSRIWTMYTVIETYYVQNTEKFSV